LTRRSQGLISGGFSASIGAWIQKPLRRWTSPLCPISTPLCQKITRTMKLENDNRRVIPLENIVATVVAIGVLTGLVFLILRWIS
jgi:hypothetical protein